VKDNKWVICSNSVVWRIVDGEAVILGADGNSYFSLNETATKMWELLDKDFSGDDIVNVVSKEYGLNKSRIKKDYEEFVVMLRKEKLIKRNVNIPTKRK